MKKKTLVIIISLLVGIVSGQAFAQQPQMTPAMQEMMRKMQSMTPQERNRMMQQMQEQATKMQECMGQNGGMSTIEAKAKEMQAHINQLCAAGQRDEAQAYALEKGKEMADDPDIKRIQECSKGMVDSMPFLKSAVDKEINSQPAHICDMKTGGQ